MGFLKNEPLRQHKIEQLLLEAHFERERGEDLIEEYFLSESSLDPVIRYAEKLLTERTDPHEREAILKNLSECIVVKMQKDKRGVKGMVRKICDRVGVFLGKSPEVLRAEALISKARKRSS